MDEKNFCIDCSWRDVTMCRGIVDKVPDPAWQVLETHKRCEDRRSEQGAHCDSWKPQTFCQRHAWVVPVAIVVAVVAIIVATFVAGGE